MICSPICAIIIKHLLCMLQIQWYIVIIITSYSFMSLREALIYCFWFFSFILVDSSSIWCHFFTLKSKESSFAPTHLLCDVTVKCIIFLYVIDSIIYSYTYCFMKLLLTQLREKGKRDNSVYWYFLFFCVDFNYCLLSLPFSLKTFLSISSMVVC